MSGYVGAQHEFHDAAFVQGWADRFVPTAPRLALFDLILEKTLPNRACRAGMCSNWASVPDTWPATCWSGMSRH